MVAASKTFVLGAGFSAFAGFPLVCGLRESVLEYITTHQHPSWKPHLTPHLHGFDEGQFYAGLNHVDPSGELQFEELLAALQVRSEQAEEVSHDPALVSLRVLQNAVGRMFWDIFGNISEVPRAYHCFASWLGEREGRTPPNAIVSFNWDVWAEWILEKAGIAWSYTEGLIVPVLKPHGSINWSKRLEKNLKAESSVWKPIGIGSPFSYIHADPFSDPFGNGANQNLRHLIFPGETESLEREGLRLLRDEVVKTISQRDAVVFIGYSLPAYDTAALRFLAPLVRGKRIEVYNPNPEHLARFRDVFGEAATLHPEKFQDSFYGTNEFVG